MTESSPSDLISARIAELADWRGATLARRLIHQADPDLVEARCNLSPVHPPTPPS